MNDDRNFERNARAWLELGPEVAPERVLHAALTTIETTSQQRDLRVPWRFPRMTTQARYLSLAAIGVIVIVAGAYMLRSPLGQIAGPGPSPTAAATISATPGSSLSASTDLDRQWLVFERQITPSDEGSVGQPTTRIWAVRGDGTEVHEVAPNLDSSHSAEFVPRPGGEVHSVVFESSGLWLGSELGDGSRIWDGLIQGDALIEGDDPGVNPAPCDSEDLADCEEFNPSFSPGAKRIAFIQHNVTTGDYVVGWQDRSGLIGDGPPRGDYTFLESTRIAGAAQQDTPDQTVLGRPSWSPSGELIAYQRTLLRDDVPVASDIYVVNADGTDNRRLPTPPGSTYADPDWSPDGSLILLSNDADRYDPFFLSMGIYTISPESGVLTTLCQGRDCGANPSWTPDGTQILAWALNAANGGTWALMDAAGSEMVPINPDLDVFTSEAEGGYVVRLQPAVTSSP